MLPGRLDSDELLFEYVNNFLKQIGNLNERAICFLYNVYGYALMDTTKLLLKQPMEEASRIEKVLYLYKKPVTKELIFREQAGKLVKSGEEAPEFVSMFYQLLFERESKNMDCQIINSYLRLFEILYPALEKKFTVEEFRFLWSKKVLLDAVTKEKEQFLFRTLIRELKTTEYFETRVCQGLLRKYSMSKILYPVLQNKKFIVKYEDVVEMIQEGKMNQALAICQNYFDAPRCPEYAEELIQLWIDLAELLKKNDDFLLGEQIKIELLIQMGKKLEVQREYEKLEQKGILLGDN